MARYKSNHVRPAKSQGSSADEPAAKLEASNAQGWQTLEELRIVIMAKGCTKAQFDQAIETVGNDPRRVANHLQRYAFTNAVPGNIKGS